MNWEQHRVELKDHGLDLGEDGLPACEACGSRHFHQVSTAAIRSYWHIDEAGRLAYDGNKVLDEETEAWVCADCAADCAPEVLEDLAEATV